MAWNFFCRRDKQREIAEEPKMSDEKAQRLNGDFSSIECNGSSDISIDAIQDAGLLNLVSETPVKLKVQDGDTLCVESESTISICGGASVFSSGSSISVSGGSISMINGRVFINGQEMRANEKVTDPEKKSEYHCRWTIDMKTPGAVRKIAVRGASVMKIWPKAAEAMLAKSLKLAVTGSGGLSLPCTELKQVSAKVSGSGSINLNKSKIQTANVDVTGSGTVKGFRAEETADLTVTGSGDIRGTVSRACQVDKTKTGSGSIRVDR